MNDFWCEILWVLERGGGRERERERGMWQARRIWVLLACNERWSSELICAESILALLSDREWASEDVWRMFRILLYIYWSFLLRPQPVCALPDKRYRKVILHGVTNLVWILIAFSLISWSTPRVVSGSHEIPPRVRWGWIQILMYGLMSSSNRLGKLEGPQTMS